MTMNVSTEIPDLSFRAALQRLDAAGLLLKVEDEHQTRVKNQEPQTGRQVERWRIAGHTPKKEHGHER